MLRTGHAAHGTWMIRSKFCTGKAVKLYETTKAISHRSDLLQLSSLELLNFSRNI